MRNRLTGLERSLVATLGAIAAVTFFLPLLSIQLPIAGDEQVTGYGAAAKLRQLTEQVRSLTGHGQGDRPSVKLPRLPSGGPGGAPGTPSKLPVSIRLSWLIPVFIVVAFACALLTLLGSLISSTLARTASAAGGVSGALALLHLSMMNSDIHHTLVESIQRGTGGARAGFLAGLAQAVGNALVNAFDLRAGAALYVLTVSLGLAAFLAWSRLVSRLRSTERVP